MPGGPLGPTYRGPMGGNPGPGPIIGGPGVPGEWFGGEGRIGEFWKEKIFEQKFVK